MATDPQPSTSAKVADKIAKGMNAVKKTVGDYVSNAKSLTGWGDDAAAAGRQIGENIKQEQDFKNASGQQPNTSNAQPEIPKYHKGGKVKKTGVARLLKGERVLSRAQTKDFERTKRQKAGKEFTSGYEGHEAIGSY